MSNDHPHHDHDHGAPGQDQGHVPEPSPADPAVPGVEDAGAQALADALQSSFRIIKFLLVVLVVVFVVSGIFTVKPNEVAIVLRFGAPVGAGADQLLKPGLHWSLPEPIDEVVRIPVGESHTITSTAGWYYQTPEEEASGQEPQALPSLRPGVDGYTLTGDGGIIHARATLTYRITDPIAYTFHFANTTNLLQHITDDALFYTSARFSADALYRNKAAFQEAVLARVTDSLEKLKLGVTLGPGEVRTDPPLYVRDAFNDVLKAQQQGDIKIREAEAYARSATNNAAGEASVILQEGITSSNRLVLTVSADADRFQALLPRFQADPRLFKQRLLAETMETVLTNAQYKTFLPERADGKSRELRLQLSKEPDVPKKEQSQQNR